MHCENQHAATSASTEDPGSCGCPAGRRWRKAIRDNKGQSLIELAILLPVWLLLVVGLLDLSRVYASYMALQNATREAARYAATYPSDISGIRSRAAREVQSSGLTLPTDRINVSCPAGACSPGRPVKVSASLDFPLISTYIVGLQKITLQAAVQFVVM